MSKHIAGKLNPIPSAVFASFQAVITARSTMYAALQQIVNKNPDPDIVRGNATRKHFIDPLTEAFEALGGSSWHSSTGPLAVKDAEDHLLLQNRVSALSLGVIKDGDDVASSEDDAYSIQARRQKKRTGKGKERKESVAGSQSQRPPPRPPPSPLFPAFLSKVIALSRTKIGLCLNILWQCMRWCKNGSS
jgi:hypothetical protein